MDEKKLFDQIRQSASDLTPPDSLSPDAVRRLLDKAETEPAESTADSLKETRTESPEKKSPEKKSPKKKYSLSSFYRLAGAAAVLVLSLTALSQMNQIQKNSPEPEQRTVRSESATDLSIRTQTENSADSSGNAQAQSSDQQPEDLQAENSADFSGNAQAQSSDQQPEDLQAENSAGSSGNAQAQSSDQQPEDLQAENSAGRSGTSQTKGSLSPAESYEEVYQTLRDRFYYDESNFYPGLGARDMVVYDAGEAEIAPYAGEEIAYDNSALSSDGDYSRTNLQEIGVDEADIVKTDGQYIYILHQDGSVTIAGGAPSALEVISVISPEDSSLTAAHELYLYGDSLSIITESRRTELKEEDSTYTPSTIAQTSLYTYDISDRSAPVLTGSVTQDGDYRTSRKNGDFIYLFTCYYPDLQATHEESRIVPLINGAELASSDFYLPEQLSASSYLVISSVDVRSPEEITDRKALVSGASNYYVSTGSIYIANESWNTETTFTELTKFQYRDGKITGVGAASVPGYLNDSFSLNEYDGYLRVVSTYHDSDWNEYNGLYIFDETLRQVSSIRDLAPGETIRSARFLGDTGYFVTFRQTDPLFSVDLSDPADPRILGELKVTGFSSYLHFYGENRLLGLGYEADEKTGAVTGLKLSMFDISDPADVTELHRIVIPEITWCESLSNYKTILIDPEKNIFGFFCENRYLVFSYDPEKGFQTELVFDLMAEELAQQNHSMYMNPWNSRGLYIEDTLYLAGDQALISFDMSNGFQKLDTLLLAE